MESYICETCGSQYAATDTPPDSCRICTDTRQFVGWEGQTWTTHDELARTHHVHFEPDAELDGIGITPRFAIPQRALHLRTDAGNILWECISLVTEEAVTELEKRGGVDMIVISHPHFYASMVEWSDAFGGVPIIVNDADSEWVNRSSPHLTPWSGDSNQLSSTVTLYRCPGHFPGSTVLHWTAGPGGKMILLSGDALHVAQDRRHVSFMYSVPNYIPAHPDHVRETRDRLRDLEFEDVYGFTWGLNIIGHGRTAVDASFDRYFDAIGHPQ